MLLPRRRGDPVPPLKRSRPQLLKLLPSIFVRVAGAALAGVLAVYVARTHGAEYSGQFFYLVSTLTIASVVTRLGAEPYLTAQVASHEEADPQTRASYLFSTVAAVVILVTAAGLALVALRAASPLLADRVLGDLPVLLLILAILGLNTMWIATGYCRALGMPAVSIFLETGLMSMWLLGLLIVCNQTSIEPTSATVALGIAILCPLLLAPAIPLILRSRNRLINFRGIRHALIGVASFGAVTITNGIIVLIPLQALVWQGLVEEAGIYNAALRISMFVGASGVVVKSLIVRQEAARERQADGRKHDLWRSAVIALPWIVISIAIAWQGHLLSALFGSEFREIEGIILVMLIAQSINVAGFLVETRAVLANERRLLNVTAGFTLAVSLCVTPVLVDAYGLQGAAWAFATTIILSRGLMVWLYVANPHSINPRTTGGDAGRVPEAKAEVSQIDNRARDT